MDETPEVPLASVVERDTLFGLLGWPLLLLSCTSGTLSRSAFFQCTRLGFRLLSPTLLGLFLFRRAFFIAPQHGPHLDARAEKVVDQRIMLCGI